MALLFWAGAFSILFMNIAHLHLLLNHFPIATLLFGFFILLFGRVRRDEGVIRVGFGVLVVGGFVAAAAYFTGDPAEDVLKAFAPSSFPKSFVSEHAQAAVFGLWSTIITACAAAAGLFLSMKKGAVSNRYLILVFVINFWALTVVARVNYLGGLISHPEIRSESKT